MTAKQVQEFKETEIGKIPADWEIKSLGEISNVTKLAGFEFTKFVKYTEDGEIIALRAQNIKNGSMDLSNVKKISKKISDSLPRSKLFRNDLLLSYTGSIGESCLIDEDNRYHLAPNVCKITTKENFEPLFLKYYFKSAIFYNLLKSYTVGSTQPTIPMKNIRLIKIPIPQLDEQKRISSFIHYIQTKIQNLQNQNRTLEQTAHAIFKSWFIDFDGITEFEDSELGKIPKGWSVEKMTEIIEVSPQRKLEKNSFSPFLSMPNTPIHSSRISNFYYRNFTSGTKFENGDTLLARITPSLENGKTAFVDFLQEDEIGWGSTEFIVLRPKAPFPPEYGYCLCRTDELRLYAIANMTGTSGRQRVQESCFDDYKIVKPSLDIIQNFSVISKNIFLKIKENGEAISSLTKTRDTLLPKLMSGEIRV